MRSGSVLARCSVLPVAAAILLGCATGRERFGRPIATERLAQIEVGRSTRSEVLALLGPPLRDPHEKKGDASADEEREPVERALYWEYSERHELFGSAILFTYYSQETLTDTLMVVFDERNVVEVVAFERETKP